ncbi:MAG TPA: alpha/beta hydrolase [Spirochaetota bacterium]
MARYNYTEGTFSGKGSTPIAYKGWAADKPKGVVVIVHGIGEHSGRYSRIVDALGGKKISFFALDLRGHGLSQGERGHIDSFLDYIFDLKIFMNMVREAHHDLPIVMLGHSLGGAIACRYALTYQNDLKGLVLSAPALTLNAKIPVIQRAAGQLLSVVTPKMEIVTGLDPHLLSHDEQEVANYMSDPLVHNKITPRLYSEILKNGEYCLDRAADIRLPLLIAHGGGDKIVSPKGSEVLFERALSDDKQLLLIPELFHEIMNETPRERAKALSAIASWIVGHTIGKMVTIKVKVPKTAKAVKKAAVAEKPLAPAQTKKGPAKGPKKPVAKKKTKAAGKSVKGPHKTAQKISGKKGTRRS